MKTKYFYLTILIAWFVVVFILSSISGDKIQRIDTFHIPHLDKFVHFIMYSVMQYLWLLYMVKAEIVNKKGFIISSSIISVLYGVLMEMLQSMFFIHRSGDLYDAITNTIGVLTVLLLYKNKLIP